MLDPAASTLRPSPPPGILAQPEAVLPPDHPARTPWHASHHEPRPWQREAYSAIRDALRRGSRRVVVQAVMASGKSVLIAELVRMSYLAGTRILVSTPTVALVDQLADTIQEWTGTRVGRWYTHAHEESPSGIMVACNPSVPEVPNVGQYQLWIADEVHRTESDTMHAAAEAIDARWAIGLSATPYRNDADARLRLWDDVVYEYTPGDGIRDGILVPYRIEAPSTDAPDLDSACRRLIRRHARGPGVVSAASIHDAEHYASYLEAHGTPARAIHSRMSRAERFGALDWLRRCVDNDHEPIETRALVHVSLLVEGVDLPWLRWLCIRRPRGRLDAIQEIGRFLRTAPGKAEALLLDPLNTMDGLAMHYPAALGWADPDPEEVREVKRKAKERGISARDAAGQALRSREPAVVRPVQRWLRQLYLAQVDAGRIEPPKRITGKSWRSARPTAKQLAHLAKMHWAARLTHPKLRPALEALLNGDDLADGLTRGAVSDLLSLLHSAPDWRREHDPRKAEPAEPWWPPWQELPPIPPIVSLLLGLP